MAFVCRLLPALAALDCLAVGLWAIFQPDGLFALLGCTPPHDAFLWSVFGYLTVANAVCLAAAAARPLEFGGFALPPWVGRLLSCALWLWLLGQNRVALASEPLWGLLAHDAFWLVALTVFLLPQFIMWRR
jgi:hypothetical protein